MYVKQNSAVFAYFSPKCIIASHSKANNQQASKQCIFALVKRTDFEQMTGFRNTERCHF